MSLKTALDPRIGVDMFEKLGPLVAVVGMVALAVVLATKVPEEMAFELLTPLISALAGAATGYYVRGHAE